MMSLMMTVMTMTRCKSAYAREGHTVTEKQICAGGQLGKVVGMRTGMGTLLFQDSCIGDSGSGLMRQVNGRLVSNEDVIMSSFSSSLFCLSWQLIGVVSFGPKMCGTQNVPGVISYQYLHHFHLDSYKCSWFCHQLITKHKKDVTGKKYPFTFDNFQVYARVNSYLPWILDTLDEKSDSTSGDLSSLHHLLLPLFVLQVC